VKPIIVAVVWGLTLPSATDASDRPRANEIFQQAQAATDIDDALAAARQIKYPSDRASALQDVAEARIEAGDQAAALVILQEAAAAAKEIRESVHVRDAVLGDIALAQAGNRSPALGGGGLPGRQWTRRG
jgi:hypothetical protein